MAAVLTEHVLEKLEKKERGVVGGREEICKSGQPESGLLHQLLCYQPQ